MTVKPAVRLLLGVFAAISATLILAINLGWRPDWLQSAAAVPTLDLACPDLARGCNFKLGDKGYRITTDGPISGKHPMQLDLAGPATSVHASWQMAGMAMGPNRYRLQAGGTGTWHTSTLLPICTQGRHDWLLILQIDSQIVQIRTIQQ
ncbi:hypothetical protein IGB42_03647 [Andreprevotia sp. IGB-42]|uniref:hypothetical protein n=1 Tax=Andreprevotia sp. IGB-42 TaxID=2497473 RepID=UPI00135C4DCE|nr:hypothetical protein [Andreprevotia sp. IGB-42]KAF0811837.1 hypothetical protein IGB42_03647 [Andreprevotia sp. IGB-42]